MKRKNEAQEQNQLRIPLLAFLESYNQNIPKGFLHASVSLLKEFQSSHPVLFKDGDVWSMAQHRKKLIDWLFTHGDRS
jgi:hypothetical protein